MDISVVIPVYGCRAALPELHQRLVNTLEGLVEEFEIILVDDRCPQNSWEVIKNICENDKRTVGVRLARNFGQIKAITAGLEQADGDWVVVMDCDLQDRPEGIAELYKKALEGYDVVFSKRHHRKDSTVTKLLSKGFYKVYNYFTEGNYDSSVNNFSIISRKVINYYLKMGEQNRAFIMFIKWLGFDQTVIELEGDKRYEGDSSYSFRKKIKLAFELILDQSNLPLKASMKLGFLISFISFFYIIYLVIRAVFFNDILLGWTTVVASIYLMGGLILAAIGIVGLYIGNIFDEVKKRPLYVVQEVLNNNMRKVEE